MSGSELETADSDQDHDDVNEFPDHRNHIPLDISLQLLQMLGPVAFLTGRPDGATAPRLPSFL